MSLHDIARTHGVSRTDTCKLFWGIYPFSLKVRIPEGITEERRIAIHHFWSRAKTTKWAKIKPSIGDINKVYREKLNAFIDAIVDKNVSLLELDDFNYVASNSNVTFYLKTEEAVAKLITNNPSLFFAYQAPISEKVAKRLVELAGKKAMIRKKNFYREYTYRITFKGLEFETLDARVQALQFEDSLYSESTYSRVLYVKSEDDFFLAKLALQDRIGEVTECFTVDEIEAA